MNFTHLHVHTRYSILDGAAGIKTLASTVKKMGMNALAITDHGNMYGAVEFIQVCTKEGIKPIIGCEVYVAEKSRFDKHGTEDRSGYHLILLAKNKVGYHNLVRLVSLGFVEGFYYKPRIDHELLEKYHEGIICCSACIAGEIPQNILNGEENKLHENISFFQSIFGDDYYFECQNHGLKEQAIVVEKFKELSQQYGIKCVATNDIHFISKEDREVHDILIRVNTNTKISEHNKLSYTGEEYVKTPEEMSVLFPDNPEFLENTQEIVDKIEEYKIENGLLLPKFAIPENFVDENEYLQYLTYEGAKGRYGEELPEEIKKRIDFELATVKRMGFPGYFLIVWDVIKTAREMGVVVGPGRGSAAGSVMAYCLHITNIDPLKYGLLFERFLNPDRISMPDIDIDFDDVGRERVIEYVREKYGKEKVAQVITYGSMAAKSAINDVARILELPIPEAREITKHLDTLGITIEKALKDNSNPLQSMLQNSSNPTVRKTIEYARKLEGCNRSTGVHACAMIIAPEAIVDYVPLGVAKGSDMPVTQYEGKYVESVGLLKMDFLGLKTLTIIKNTLQNIKWRHNLDIDIDTVPLNDKKTYDLFGRGDTTAIFQFESDGMKKYLRELKPERFEDLIAMNALYRPGPMEYIPNFIRRKHGLEAITCDLPDMSDILSDTYGITVYQEHVMLLSQKLANFTGGEADTLRKAMGKKQLDTLVKMKDKFVSGCAENKLDSKTCDKIWDDWLAFANYAFNKSHAACYAYIAYQTAYLKAHYPAEFMAAVLTSNLGSIDQITFFIDDCLHQKIQVLPPDINESLGVFSVNKDGAIRFGLNGIKGVGEGVVENIVNERNENGSYENIVDFVSRSDLKALNRKAIESLVKSGAFDVFDKPSRQAYFYKANDNAPDFIEQILQYVKKSAQNSSIGSLFDDDTAGSSLEIMLPEVEEWSDFTKLMYEKEVAGYYISGHPLNKYELEIKQFANADIRQMNDMFKESSKYAGKSVRIAGMIAAAEHRQTRFNVPYGIFTIVDKDSSIRLSLFKDIYMKFGHFLVPNPPTPVFCYATLTSRGFGDSINYDWSITDMFLLDDLLNRNTHHIKLQVELSEINKGLIADLHTLIEKYRVEKNPKAKQTKISDIIFIVKDTKSGISVTMPSATSVEPSSFLHDLQSQECFDIFDITLS